MLRHIRHRVPNISNETDYILESLYNSQVIWISINLLSFLLLLFFFFLLLFLFFLFSFSFSSTIFSSSSFFFLFFFSLLFIFFFFPIFPFSSFPPPPSPHVSSFSLFYFCTLFWSELGNCTSIFKVILCTLQDNSAKLSDEELLATHDGQRFQALVDELVKCKEDAQQRSWALHEDESVIAKCLEDLLSILVSWLLYSINSLKTCKVDAEW